VLTIGNNINYAGTISNNLPDPTVLDIDPENGYLNSYLTVVPVTA
jgi:hypothetical protein